MTTQEWMDYTRLAVLVPGLGVSLYGLWASLFQTLLPYYRRLHECPQLMLMRYASRATWFVILVCLTTNSVNRLWLGNHVALGFISQGAFTLLLAVNTPITLWGWRVLPFGAKGL